MATQAQPRILPRGFLCGGAPMAALAAWLCCTVALQAADTVRIGVLIRDDKGLCYRHWGPTADYLSTQVPPFRFEIVPLTYAEVIPAARAGTVDFLLTNPVQFILLEEENLASPLATMRGRSYGGGYGSVLFWRADRRDIRGARDIAGKRIAAVSRQSLGGWLAAEREFLDVGVDLEQAVESVAFHQSHSEVARHVVTGQADIGICRTGTLEDMASRGEVDPAEITVACDFVISRRNTSNCNSTRLYPEWPFLAVGATDGRLAAEVREALLVMGAQDRAADESHVAGWIVAANYSDVRRLLRTLAPGGFTRGAWRTFVHSTAEGETWAVVQLSLAVAVLVLVGLLAAQHLRNARERTARQAVQEELAGSRRFLESVVGQIPQPFAVIGLDYQVLMANRAAQHLYGWTPSDGVLPCHQLMRGLAEPCHACDDPCLLERILASGHAEMIEITHATAAGQPAHLQVFGAPVLDDQGQIQHIVEWSLDVTERVEAKRVLEQRGELLGLVVASLPGLSFLVDAQGRYLAANDAFLGFAGASGEDVIGALPAAILEPATAAALTQGISEADAPAETPVIDHEGNARVLSMRWIDCRSSTGVHLGTLGVGTPQCAPNAGPLVGVRVVVAAGDANTRDALEQVCNAMHMHVDSVASAAGVLRVLSTSALIPDAVVLDWQLEDVSAADAVGDLANGSAYGQRPVLVLCDNPEQAVLPGAVIRLPRPLAASALAAALTEALNKAVNP